MPFGLGVWELLLIFAVLLLVVGAKRLPDLGGALGRGVREVKTSVRDTDSEPKRPAEPTRLPASACALGRGIREFRSSGRDIDAELQRPADQAQRPLPPPAAGPPVNTESRVDSSQGEPRK